MGVGTFGAYNNKDITMKIWWKLNGEKSEEFVRTCPEDEKDETMWSHDINFTELGGSAVKVASGERLTCFIRLQDISGERSGRQWYGHKGSESEYNTID